MRHIPAFQVRTGAASSLQFRRRYLLLALIFTFSLFFLGSQPFAANLFPVPWDKLAHFFAFSIITALLFFGTGGRMPLLVIAIVVAIGALDEWHQAGLSGRSANIYDFLTDVGAAIAIVGLLQFSRKIKCANQDIE